MSQKRVNIFQRMCIVITKKIEGRRHLSIQNIGRAQTSVVRSKNPTGQYDTPPRPLCAEPTNEFPSRLMRITEAHTTHLHDATVSRETGRETDGETTWIMTSEALRCGCRGPTLGAVHQTRTIIIRPDNETRVKKGFRSVLFSY